MLCSINSLRSARPTNSYAQKQTKPKTFLKRYQPEHHFGICKSFNISVATATDRSLRIARSAVRLRPWNGDLSLLRGTHHDPDLSRPEVQPEQRCCIQRSASGSCLSRSESRQLTTARRPLTSPASAGLFYGSFAFRIGLFCLPTFKPNCDGEGHTHGKASTNQHHTNFHRHQHHLLLPQIIGQKRH